MNLNVLVILCWTWIYHNVLIFGLYCCLMNLTCSITIIHRPCFANALSRIMLWMSKGHGRAAIVQWHLHTLGSLTKNPIFRDLCALMRITVWIYMTTHITSIFERNVLFHKVHAIESVPRYHLFQKVKHPIQNSSTYSSVVLDIV